MNNFFSDHRQRARLSWALACVFYLYQFTQRMALTIASEPLSASFNIDKAQLGQLSAVYFYAYALMQVPAGLLLDKFGLRRCTMFGLCCLVLGVVVFANAQDLNIALLARALMGIGSCFAFLGCMKAVVGAFHPQFIAFAIGLTNALGVVGSWIAGVVVADYIQQYSWQDAWLLLSSLGASIWVLFYYWMPKELSQGKLAGQWPRGALFKACTDAALWAYALIAALLLIPIVSFAELWAVPFFVQGCHIELEVASTMPMWVFLGVAIGGPCNGLVSRLLSPKLILAMSACLIAVITSQLALQSTLVMGNLPQMLFGLGFCCSSLLLCFRMSQQRYPESCTALITGCVNTVMTVVSACGQFIMGKMIGYSGPYAAKFERMGLVKSSYSYAVWILPLAAWLALILLLGLVWAQARPAKAGFKKGASIKKRI